MADNSETQLRFRTLTLEERRWVGDLTVHPGFQLFQQAVKEDLNRRLVDLLDGTEIKEVFRSQGAIKSLESVLRLPQDLMAGSSSRPPQV